MNEDSLIGMLISNDLKDVKIGVALFRSNYEQLNIPSFSEKLLSHTEERIVPKNGRRYVTSRKLGNDEKVMVTNQIWKKTLGHKNDYYNTHYFIRYIQGQTFRLYIK